MRPGRPTLLACLLLAGSLAQACTIPVFRYALDRWPADKYRLELSTNDARDEGVARFLRNFTDSTPVNLLPVRLKSEGESRLGFPSAEPEAAPAWSGNASKALTEITDSPTRTELIRRILAGESGVWVLVESGNAETDGKAAAAMEKRLRYLGQVAAPPVIDPNDPSSQLGPGPALKASFSLLRVRHDNAVEQPFLKMLAGPKGAPDQPWFALVFGRGRVLGAWPATDFGDEQIDEACLFLLGACSCQVKRMNPGWDLVLNVDWDEKLHAMGIPAVPSNDSAPTAAKATPAPAPETVTFTPTAPAPVAPAATPNTHHPLLAPAAALALVGAGLAAWFARRQS